MSDLSKKQCLPCRGGVPPLKGPDLDALFAQLDGGMVGRRRASSREGVSVRRFSAGAGLHQPGLVKWRRNRITIPTSSLPGAG